MKTMKDYSCFCTPEQTRKALELGAPIRNFITKEESKRLVDKAKSENRIDEYENELLKYHQTIIDDMVYCIPTAEQMCGWLRKQGLCVEIISKKYFGDCTKLYKANLWKIPEVEKLEDVTETNDYKEATLAAIDEALNFLTNNKK